MPNSSCVNWFSFRMFNIWFPIFIILRPPFNNIIRKIMFKIKQSSHYIAYIVTQRFFDRCFSLEIPIVLIIFSSTFLPFGQEVSLAFSSVNSDWDFTCFRKFNNCYILLLNSLQSLENTGFVAGELSIIVSLVLYRTTSVYEIW